MRVFGESVGYADLNTVGPFVSALRSSSALHSFASSYTAFSPFPRTFSSVFWLSGTCWVSLFSLSLTFLLIIDLVWHFSFPCPLPFSILLKINLFTQFNPGFFQNSILFCSRFIDSFVSSYTTVNPITRTFSSVFWLRGTCWVSLFSLSLVSLLIIDLEWHFSFPWSSSFFILLKINKPKECFNN